jgi:outer membrane lipopolysaccharide assembly protein LptE/RlpB
MKKLIKKLILIILPLMLLGCGYVPMYKNLNNLNYSIIIDETSGNRKINNILKSKLNNYSSNNENNKYKITINSSFEKIIVAKDTTGAATEYKLTVVVVFNIISDKFNKQLKYSENFSMQSISDKLEEQDYEENIQNSLANTIARKLILQLSQIQ